MPSFLTYATLHGTVTIAATVLMGLLIGSFLNVVIHRLPLMMQRDLDLALTQDNTTAQRYNLITPGSACSHCAKPIAVRHNIPLLSYLLLGGRCAHCRAPIGRRYPAVEIISALLSVVTVNHFGLGMQTLAALVLVYFLIALSGIDAQTQLLPDMLTLPLLWLGLLVNLNDLFVPLREAVIGTMAGYLSLWLIYWLFRLSTGKEGIGYGDFKLFAALGAWLGWAVLPLILLLASCMGAIVGIALVLLKRHTPDQALPFGPYLAGSSLLMLLYGPDLLRAVQSLALPLSP